ncbi:unnamed protein product [Clavelina lepadiformis]|uniref:Uncharacterized protein n=1 Tax=Clavelina lepadiformis TaxID=159417 RepID=A0ABP0F6H3_CLALP
MDSNSLTGFLMMPGQSAMDVASAVQGPIHNVAVAALPQDKAVASGNQSISARKTKMRLPAGSIKSESKGDDEMLILHSNVQEKFASNLATLLNDPLAQELQCCVTYGKPCGCIRKYVLAGVHWKDNSSPNLRIALIKDKNESEIVAKDLSSITQIQLTRAKEMLDILHHAAELKKEKCYNVTSDNSDGKPLKELRGMIGLGNGRKRSKKYEDYVLEKRGKLRNEYSLCEKAAQKLLGYSINFLYKKLRTNPQKTSRLVATNKAERASKVPRHLISLQQLQEMANNQQSASQCCCRNCISWLVKQHFEKIVDWRRRLEGSGQRVAQEIVAEVLLASASLDGQNSFCQNLVHWVTGCSFKKIRRVRDHLKKDPKSLPEHGLKKYWKEKVRNQTKRAGSYSKVVLPKTEKDIEAFSGMGQLDRFPVQYDGRMSTQNSEALNTDGHISNVNNSNNRCDRLPYQLANSPKPPPNQTIHDSGMINMFSGMRQNSAFVRDDGVVYQALQRPQQNEQTNNSQIYMASNQQENNTGLLPTANNVGRNFSGQNSAQAGFGQQSVISQNNNFYSNSQNVTYDSQVTQPNYISKTLNRASETMVQSIAAQQQLIRNNPAMQNTPHRGPEHGHYQEAHSIQQESYSQQGRLKDGQPKFYSNPFIAGSADPSGNMEHAPPAYYFTTNTGNPQQDSFFHAGMAPLILAQTQQPDGNQGEQDLSMPSQFASQSFLLLSPAVPNAHDKNGNYTANDFENWKQIGMPLTPIQMYSASYLAQPGIQSEADSKNIQAWSADVPHFMFPVSDSNMALNQTCDQQNYNSNSTVNENKRQGFSQGGQPHQYFQPTLTPVAVMPTQGNSLFSNMGWFATQPSIAQSVVQDGEVKKHCISSQPYMQSEMEMEETNQSNFYENKPLGQRQGLECAVKDGYGQTTKALPLQVVSQGMPSSQNFVESSTQSQWDDARQVETQTHKPHYAQQQTMPTGSQSAQDISGNVQLLQNNQTSSSAVAKSVVNTKTTDASLPEQVNLESIDVVSTANSKQTAPLEAGKSPPRGAPIGDRSKRFSRDRLRATIDSPGLLPMTPLTPALTPVIIPVIDSKLESTNSGKEDSLSASSGKGQAMDSTVFRFPPAHVSRRVAALRMQGQTMDITKSEKSKMDKPINENQCETTYEENKTCVSDEGRDQSNTADKSQKETTQSRGSSISGLKSLPGSLGSAGSLGYIPETFMNPDSHLLIAWPNEKSLPVLSLPSGSWCDDTVTNDANKCEGQADQHLKTPTQVLNTPTHQLTPSVSQLQTPTHSLNTPQSVSTPTQTLNTPTHQLNTPTQPLNTPTDVTSPTHSTVMHVTPEDGSPVKVLLPAPAGKKRRVDAEGADVTVDKKSNEKPIRFHIFTPKDFEGGEVNVSAFRKPSEFAAGTNNVGDTCTPKRRRKRKQPYPQTNNSNQTIEIQDQDTDKSDHSADEESIVKEDANELHLVQSADNQSNLFQSSKSTIEIASNSESLVPISGSVQFPPLRTPAVLQHITPVFVQTSVPEDMSQTSCQSQPLTTPVFLHSGTLVTPSNRLNSILCKASPVQPGTSGRSSSSTPQFFTFMPASSFGTSTMFFTPDSSGKSSAKVKSNDAPEDGESLKTKFNSNKKSQLTRSVAHSAKDDALQMSSNIQVTSPVSAGNTAGATSDSSQVFSFQGSPEPKTKHKNLSTKEPVSQESLIISHNSPAKSNSGEDPVKLAMKEQTAEHLDQNYSSEDTPSVPSLVVDPPSDGESDNLKSSPKLVTNPQTISSPKETTSEENVKETSLERPSLLRSRSGGKAGLVLSLNTQSSDLTNILSPSPLNTPSGIQVITPTLGGMRIRPQPLVVAPVCLNPGNNLSNQSGTGMQVATPTLFHIISPSQVAPASPSVFVYPYPPRGFGGISSARGSGPLSGGR